MPRLTSIGPKKSISTLVTDVRQLWFYSQASQPSFAHLDTKLLIMVLALTIQNFCRPNAIMELQSRCATTWWASIRINLGTGDFAGNITGCFALYEISDRSLRPRTRIIPLSTTIGSNLHLGLFFFPLMSKKRRFSNRHINVSASSNTV